MGSCIQLQIKAVSSCEGEWVCQELRLTQALRHIKWKKKKKKLNWKLGFFHKSDMMPYYVQGCQCCDMVESRHIFEVLKGGENELR